MDARSGDAGFARDNGVSGIATYGAFVAFTWGLEVPSSLGGGGEPGGRPSQRTGRLPVHTRGMGGPVERSQPFIVLRMLTYNKQC